MDGIIGKKIGMTSIFDDAGKNIACTVVEAKPNVVVQKKLHETDRYNAVQLAYDEINNAHRVNRPTKGHFAKSGLKAHRKLIEFREFSLDKKEGDTVDIEEVFEVGDIVNAVGVSKGKGFQGVVKRHGFHGVGEATHGQGHTMRAPGSIGASSDPSKVFKGMRMAGQTGNSRVKIKNLKVAQIFPEKNLFLIKGAIPGHKGSYVIIEK